MAYVSMRFVHHESPFRWFRCSREPRPTPSSSTACMPDVRQLYRVPPPHTARSSRAPRRTGWMRSAPRGHPADHRATGLGQPECLPSTALPFTEDFGKPRLSLAYRRVVGIDRYPVMTALLARLQRHHRGHARAADALRLTIEDRVRATALLEELRPHPLRRQYSAAAQVSRLGPRDRARPHLPIPITSGAVQPFLRIIGRKSFRRPHRRPVPPAERV